MSEIKLKQRITMTPVVYNVILEDLGTFTTKGTVNGFINHLIPCMMDRPEVNIQRAIRDRQQDYLGRLQRSMVRAGSLTIQGRKGDTRDNPTERLALALAQNDVASDVRSFRDTWRASLREHYADKRDKILLLTASHADLLERRSENWEEDGFYTGPKEFLESMLYHYAILPTAERERIYFAPQYRYLTEKVEMDRSKRSSIIVTLRHDPRADERRRPAGKAAATGDAPAEGQDGRQTAEGRPRRRGPQQFRVIPYAIEQDMSGLHYYLAGISWRVGEEDRPYNCANYRLSRIEDIRLDDSQVRMTEEQERELRQMIDEVGIQFVQKNDNRGPHEVHVRLTPDGMRDYWRISRNRPHILRDKDGKECVTECENGDRIVTFWCSDFQAILYFLPFTDRAEVLDPPELRDRMRARYQHALEMYES